MSSNQTKSSTRRRQTYSTGFADLMNTVHNVSNKKPTNEENSVKEITKNMDKDNANVTKIMMEEGIQAGVKAMFTEKDANGKERQLSYSEMRYRYG